MEADIGFEGERALHPELPNTLSVGQWRAKSDKDYARSEAASRRRKSLVLISRYRDLEIARH